jgi:hypothetical protein
MEPARKVSNEHLDIGMHVIAKPFNISEFAKKVREMWRTEDACERQGHRIRSKQSPHLLSLRGAGRRQLTGD